MSVENASTTASPLPPSGKVRPTGPVNRSSPAIAPAILEHYPELNEVQRKIVGHLDGPLLVVAGPGSGKTHSIVLRALNLLLLRLAQPRQIILCTFTDKAAFEMRDRLTAAAHKVGYKGDLSELTASTIHSFCNRVLTQHRHRTALGHNYETLDELTQLLFVFERFEEIIGPQENDRFLGRWKTRWTAIKGASGYFDKITEELVDPERLTGCADPFLVAIGNAYCRYERALIDANRTDFAHLQRLVHDLLDDPTTADAVASDLRYVLVDEYQDTNYIQEQLLLKLTETGLRRERAGPDASLRSRRRLHGYPCSAFVQRVLPAVLDSTAVRGAGGDSL